MLQAKTCICLHIHSLVPLFHGVQIAYGPIEDLDCLDVQANLHFRIVNRLYKANCILEQLIVVHCLKHCTDLFSVNMLDWLLKLIHVSKLEYSSGSRSEEILYMK